MDFRSRDRAQKHKLAGPLLLYRAAVWWSSPKAGIWKGLCKFLAHAAKSNNPRIQHKNKKEINGMAFATGHALMLSDH